MTPMMPTGFPPPVATHPLIEQIGLECCISPSLSIWRRSPPDADAPLIRLGDKVVVFDYVRMVVGGIHEYPHAGIQIGSGTMINCGSFLSGEGGLIIENEVLIGPQVKILSAGHQIDDGHETIHRNSITFSPVHIEEGAWLGAGATVTQGCRIGKGAVVAAGSVVTHDIPPFAVVTGVPARILRYRRFSDPLPV